MADEIGVLGGPDYAGHNVYAHRINHGQYWNTTGTPGYEDYDESHWADYAIGLTESSPGNFFGDWSGPAESGGGYIGYDRVGGSPAASDKPIGFGTIYYWDGEAEVNQTDLVGAPNAAAVTAIQSGLATATNLAALAGKFSGITSLASWLRAAIRADAPDETALTEINNTGGDYDPSYMSLEFIGTQTDEDSQTLFARITLAADGTYDIVVIEAGVEIDPSGVTDATVTVWKGDGTKLIDAGAITHVSGGKYLYKASGGEAATSGQSLFPQVSLTNNGGGQVLVSNAVVAP